MIAVDTNVLIPLLTSDDPAQEAVVRPLFARESSWIAKTVLLETGWVLRSFYRLDDATVRDALTKLLGLKNVHVEDEPGVAAALALHAHGIDFADAMHLASWPPDTAFLTFDDEFVRRAKHLGVRAISSPAAKY